MLNSVVKKIKCLTGQINVKMKTAAFLGLLSTISYVSCARATDISSLSGLESLSKASILQNTVAPCNACRNLVESFTKALEDTTRMSYQGGDADWEREKLGNYETSELRFIEIQEKLCSELKSGIDQCYNLAELHEAKLEEWFFNKNTRMRSDLFSYLCIDHLKTCCPDNTYGPNCIPCPGGADPCSGHGKCKNGGTREEPTECICDAGYAGDLCNECKTGYYRDITVPKLVCNACDKACKDHCRGPGPKNCEVCSEGYNFVPNEGCLEEEEQEDEDSQTSAENSSSESEHSDKQLNPELLNLNEQQSDHQEL